MRANSPRLTVILLGCAALAGAAVWGGSQPPPGPVAKATPASVTKQRPVFSNLPPTPPDWDFVQKMVFSRFPDAKPEEVTKFMTENVPLKLRTIREMARTRPDDAVELLTDLVYESIGVMALRESQPLLYEARIRQLKFDAEIDRWTEASRQSKGDAREKDLEALRKALEQGFDVRQELMKSEVELLEKRLQQLKDLVQKRQENRKTIIAQRLAELTGEQKPLKW
jgi:hypothetical protein